MFKLLNLMRQEKKKIEYYQNENFDLLIFYL